MQISANVTARVEPGKDYFYLYRLSYMYTIVIGFLITYFVGWLLSKAYSSFNKRKGSSENVEINPELFFPPIAKALRRNNANNLLADKSLENGNFSYTTKL